MRWAIGLLVVAAAARWRGYAGALGWVTVMSLLIGQVLGRVSLANISMLYLIAVLATAVGWGRGPAVLAAILSFLTFDWFFVQPQHQFTVSDPEEWISLLLFLLTAVVTGQLAAGLRQRAYEARRRERDALLLADLAQMAADPDLQAAQGSVADRLRRELDLAAAVIEVRRPDGSTWRVERGEKPALRLIQGETPSSQRILHGVRRGQDSASPPRPVRVVGAPHRQPLADDLPGVVHVVPIQGATRQVGSLLMVAHQGTAPFDAVTERLLASVASQLGLAIERDALRQSEVEAEVLRRTDELKTALLNAVSHDLRTPLASIIASAGSLRQEDVTWTPAERHDFIQAIEDEALRLNRLVGNLLDLSRMEGGSLRPERSWYDLAALVDDVLGRLRPLTVGHPVTASLPDDLPPIYLDYVEIDQVLSNLVENAAKYTPTGAGVHVSARSVPGAVAVTVEDEGPGIPPASLARVFDRFYRVDSSGDRHTTRVAGTGLGLAVARGLVEAHGGRIWAENRPEGGARFVFTLPATADSAAPTPVGVGQ